MTLPAKCLRIGQSKLIENPPDHRIRDFVDIFRIAIKRRDGGQHDCARFDAMVIVPCSMSTLGRIATGSGQGALLRAADVFLKERRKLIVVPRETPWSLIQARNVVTLIEAGAIVLPAVPSFYSGPKNVNEVADTVVWRILDQLGLPSPQAFRWQSQQAGRRQI